MRELLNSQRAEGMMEQRSKLGSCPASTAEQLCDLRPVTHLLWASLRNCEKPGMSGRELGGIPERVQQVGEAGVGEEAASG